MHDDPVLFTIFVIFSGAAALATIALYARQALPVTYILLGMLLGPWGLGPPIDPTLIKGTAHVGIIFLLFLLGLNLHPQKLIRLIRETTVVTGISSLLFGITGTTIGMVFGYSWFESFLIGAALMFSSTIVGLKLLPTTVLHHKRTGEIIISILLLQDLFAIVILLFIRVQGSGELPWARMGLLIVSLPALIGFAYVFERLVLIKLIRRFDKIQEYVFLLAVGWCLGMAELASALGLSPEVGAFIAGVAVATSPISFFIAENLKPLRDFFLVMFFFSLGAGFNFAVLPQVLVPACLLAAVTLFFKPLIFRALLVRTGESPRRGLEIGVRLGQMSEFSLLIAVLASELGTIGNNASYLIQMATLLTFIVSPYVTVLNYPTPIAVSDRLRRD